MIKSENAVIEKNEINQKKRAKIGKTFGLVGMIANILLATGKLIAGISIASVSVIADALNNYSDAVSSIVTLVGFRKACGRRPSVRSCQIRIYIRSDRRDNDNRGRCGAC